MQYSRYENVYFQSAQYLRIITRFQIICECILRMIAKAHEYMANF